MQSEIAAVAHRQQMQTEDGAIAEGLTEQTAVDDSVVEFVGRVEGQMQQAAAHSSEKLNSPFLLRVLVKKNRLTMESFSHRIELM